MIHPNEPQETPDWHIEDVVHATRFNAEIRLLVDVANFARSGDQLLIRIAPDHHIERG